MGYIQSFTFGIILGSVIYLYKRRENLKKKAIDTAIDIIPGGRWLAGKKEEPKAVEKK